MYEKTNPMRKAKLITGNWTKGTMTLVNPKLRKSMSMHTEKRVTTTLNNTKQGLPRIDG